jgi:hypothetical protein
VNRRTRAVIFNYGVRPPLLIIGGIVRSLYWLLYGWWGEKRYLAKAQKKLTEQIEREFSFLFDEHKAKIIPNERTGDRMLAGWSVVTLSVEGLLLRFVPWRDTRQVHIASEHLPIEWQDLSAILNAIDPDNSHNHSIIVFQDAARILRKDWNLIKEAFSPERYPSIKEQLRQEHRVAMGITRMVQNEVNRKLYPDELK